MLMLNSDVNVGEANAVADLKVKRERRYVESHLQGGGIVCGRVPSTPLKFNGVIVT